MANKRGNANSNYQSPSALADVVINMRKQGFTNNQIIASLQREGFDINLIFDALNQADLKEQHAQLDEAPQNNPSSDQSFQPSPNQPPVFPNQQQQYIRPDMQEYMSPPQSFAYDESEVEKIEELVEAVVEEKWVDLVKDVNKIIEWKSEVESEIVSIKQKIEDLRIMITDLQKSIIGKVEDYDKNITKVNTNLKAMQNVFQKVIPSFTENINELSRTVEALKNIVKKK